MIQSISLSRRLILYLFVLNIADWYFTCYGIEQRYIEEANPLLSSVITTNPMVVLLWKCTGPLLLFYLLPYCRNSWVQHALLFTLCLYIAVNVYHLLFFVLHLV